MKTNEIEILRTAQQKLDCATHTEVHQALEDMPPDLRAIVLCGNMGREKYLVAATRAPEADADAGSHTKEE